MKRIITVILVCVVIVIIALHDARADVIADDLKQLLQTLGPDKEVAVIVTLADTVDLKKIKDKDKSLRRSKIIKALKNKSDTTQKSIKKYLLLNKVKKIKSFWIFNGLALTATAEMIEKIAGFKGVESINLDATLSITEQPVPALNNQPEWNIDAIRAPELWNMGYTGAGTVLASVDSGVDVNHQDLASRWRGGLNSWYDPNGEHATPYDASGHGTSVMGVMVGGDAGGSAIGVAPGAQWISVKIFNDSGYTTDSKIHAGYQWLLDPDGNPGTDDAPDVINNSWGYPQLNGTCLTKFQPDIQALKASEIAVVFSAGNGGPNASTGESPANNPESFAVGAVDATETIAFFSARGPSTCDGGTFPDMVAPGVNVRTSDLGNSYLTVQGTSIAAPHIAGAMGVLLSAYPSLTITELETALTESALDLGTTGPDNTYGNGFLDVMGAFNLLSQGQGQAPIAHNDIVIISRNSTRIINILANDVDPDGTLDPASVLLRSSTTARGGTVNVLGDGTVFYIPEGGGGPDYFWYTVDDNDGLTSNEATVRVNRVRAQ